MHNTIHINEKEKDYLMGCDGVSGVCFLMRKLGSQGIVIEIAEVTQ